VTGVGSTEPARRGGPGFAGAGAGTVEEIVADVRARGDAAVCEWSLRLDGVEPARAEPTSAPDEAVLALAARVRRWHEAQRPADVTLEIEPGVELQRRWVPLRSVGIYVPRGLVSTLVMCAVPAQAAGVERIVVMTPPGGAAMENRRLSMSTPPGASDFGGSAPGGAGAVAAAARLLGIDEVWAVGGAQAIAALAYGTESIPRVDKIVGPGSPYVNDAKLLVSRDVAIDLPAGPSEVVVVLGRGGDRAIAALEVAAQAEHGHDAVCRVVDGEDLDRALDDVERLAPEHVVLLGDAVSLASRIRNAGAIFVGDSSPVASGDYATGGNHVLPTGGWARSVGGLGLETFLKPVVVQRLTPEGLARVRPTVEALAAVEGMSAHAAAVQR
jgi:histidinol dehydrogenase